MARIAYVAVYLFVRLPMLLCWKLTGYPRLPKCDKCGRRAVDAVQDIIEQKPKDNWMQWTKGETRYGCKDHPVFGLTYFRDGHVEVRGHTDQRALESERTQETTEMLQRTFKPDDKPAKEQEGAFYNGHKLDVETTKQLLGDAIAASEKLRGSHG